MSILKKRTLIASSLILFVVLIVKIVAPWGIRRAILSKVNESETCRLSVERLHVSVFPPSIMAENPKLKAFSGGVEIEVEAKHLKVGISLFPLLMKKQVRLTQIDVENPNVIVTERDASPQKKEEGGESEKIDLEIQSIEVKEGDFTYAHEHDKHKAAIHVSQINTSIGAVGNSAVLIAEKTNGRALGVLEHSGIFILSVGAYVFSKTPRVNVELQIRNQNLADLNVFFKPDDAVVLKGFIFEGSSSVDVNGSKLKATAYAKFKDFDAKLEKNEERSALSATLQTFIASLATGKQNVEGDKKYSRTGTVILERKPKQSLVSFILSGMQQAAMKVSSKAGN